MTFHSLKLFSIKKKFNNILLSLPETDLSMLIAMALSDFIKQHFFVVGLKNPNDNRRIIPHVSK